MQNLLTNYSAPGRWHKGLEERMCSYTGYTLNTQVNTNELEEATSSSPQHIKCSCDPSTCLICCIYLNKRDIFSLSSFTTKNPIHIPKPSPVYICVLSYIKCQRDIEASVSKRWAEHAALRTPPSLSIRSSGDVQHTSKLIIQLIWNNFTVNSCLQLQKNASGYLHLQQYK